MPQDWPRFRGPGGAGLSDSELPVSFGPDDYNWRVELPGRGHSSPIIVGGSIFVTASIGEDQRVLICLATDTGRVRWQRESNFDADAQPQIHQLNSLASSTPAADDQRVVVAWRDGNARVVIALSHDNEELWQRRLDSYSATHGATSSIVLVDGIALLAHDNEGAAKKSFLTGLDAATGETVWTLERTTTEKRASYATPAVRMTTAGAEVIFASTAHGLTGVDPRNGKIVWELEGLFTDRCVSSPVVADGLVFATAGTGGGGKQGVAVAPDGKDGPAVRYQLRRGLPYVPTPVVFGQRLFLWSEGGMVSCLSTEDGEEVWRERVEGKFYGSPICSGGRLYAMSTDGELVVLDADAEFKLRGRVDLGEPTHATPAVAGGVLYLRTESHLISVGRK